MTPKEEWLKFSGLNYSPSDRWLRNKIARLFDIKRPTEAQKKLLFMAERRLSLMDLPSGLSRGHEAELRELAEAEFGRPPLPYRSWREIFVRVLTILTACTVLGLLLGWLERHR
jgi:hypothetical protein